MEERERERERRERSLPSGVVEQQLSEGLLLFHEVGLGEGGVGEEGVLREVEGEGESMLALALELGAADITEEAQGLLVVLGDGVSHHGVVLHGREPEVGNTLDFCS